MRYDTKIEIVQKKMTLDEYGGMSYSEYVLIDVVDAFIAPITTIVGDLGENGLQKKRAKGKIFTKAKIGLDSNQQIKVFSGAKYNSAIRFNLITPVTKDQYKNIRIIVDNEEYEIYSIVDLGKITMMEVERDG